MRLTRFIITFIAALVLPLAATGSADASRRHQISVTLSASGTITSPTTGRPVEGASVVLFSDIGTDCAPLDLSTTTSDAAGHYAVSFDFSSNATCPHQRSTTFGVRVTGGTTDVETRTYKSLRKSVSAVIDASVEPLPVPLPATDVQAALGGAQVDLSWSLAGPNVAASYDVECVDAAAATFVRTIDNVNYLPYPSPTYAGSVLLPAGSTYTCRVRGTNASGKADWSAYSNAVTVPAAANHVGSGTVLSGGVPVAGATVTAIESTCASAGYPCWSGPIGEATTDSDGHFDLSSNQPLGGTLTFTATAPGYQASPETPAGDGVVIELTPAP